MVNKLFLAGIMAFFLCGIFLDSSWAGGMGRSGPKIEVKKKAEGTIGLVDRISNAFTIIKKINDREFELNFLFNSSTAVMKNGQPKTIADVKTGDEVVVIYVREGGNNLAKNITIGKE